MRKRLSRQDEPTAADLAMIDAEHPLIDAEMAWLDAEIRMLTADERGGPTPLDWRRLRRAEARAIRQAFTYTSSRLADSQRRRAA